MSFFSKILDKLGIGHHGDAGSSAAPTASPASTSAPTPAPAPGASPALVDNGPAPIAIVDVEAQMERRAAASSQKLNWRTSIVDLLKLLDLDSSLEARKALAVELHCPPELMNDSAQMNVWLHKMVIAKIAVNGGSIPKSMLD